MTAPPPSSSTVGSAVYLNQDVDDFVGALSQACVNPLFGGGTAADPQKDADPKGTTSAVVVPSHKKRAAAAVRRRRRQAQQPPRKNEDEDDAALSSTADAVSTTTPASLSSSSAAGATNSTTAAPSQLVTARLADCLACSGCITTAETVLVEEQHSLQLLRDMFLRQTPKDGSDSNSSQKQQLVVTISPASWADLARHWGLLGGESKDNMQLMQQLATLLHRYLHVTAVLDGNVPLQWSRQAAADEFVAAYRQQQNEWKTKCEDNVEPMDVDGNDTAVEEEHEETWEDTVPSVAVSADETLYYSNGEQRVKVPTNRPRTRQALPLVTASCPAVVCLVEKTSAASATNTAAATTTSATATAAGVAHLSTVPSPMTVVAQFWRRLLAASSSSSAEPDEYDSMDVDGDPNDQSPAAAAAASAPYFHLAVMPCHDKKLEASRRDFVRDDGNRKDVDMVVTTAELLRLLREEMSQQREDDGSSSNSNSSSMRDMLRSLPPATVQPVERLEDATNSLWSTHHPNNNHGPVLFVPSFVTIPTKALFRAETSQKDADEDHSPWTTNYTSDNDDTESFFALGSGGYADYVFRCAARELFGCEDVEPVWCPVSVEPQGRVSARVAKRRRDYYEAVLCRSSRDDDGSYFVRTTTKSDAKQDDTVVLRFGIAYGMQTVQRALQRNSNAEQSPPREFDYIEAMACPGGGCLNGGGQVRIHGDDLTSTETPTETRQRVAATRRQFVAAPPPTHASTPPLRYTRYHVVPVLQHSLGAAAGVAVSDTQW